MAATRGGRGCVIPRLVRSGEGGGGERREGVRKKIQAEIAAKGEDPHWRRNGKKPPWRKEATGGVLRGR